MPVVYRIVLSVGKISMGTRERVPRITARSLSASNTNVIYDAHCVTIINYLVIYEGSPQYPGATAGFTLLVLVAGALKKFEGRYNFSLSPQFALIVELI